ncbi:MAG: SH3 domain-containing protein [Bdellovibrionia bacterium]
MKSIRRCIRSSVAFLVVLNAVASLAWSAGPAPAAGEGDTIHATVSKNSVNLRTAPDIRSKASRIRLNKGDVVIVRRASEPGWFEIQLPTPFKGFYVRQDLLTLDESK